MFYFSLKSDGHCLHTAMRMATYTSSFTGAVVMFWSTVVKHKEGADFLSECHIGEERENIESIAYPMRLSPRQDALDLFNGRHYNGCTEAEFSSHQRFKGLLKLAAAISQEWLYRYVLTSILNILR